MKVALTEPGTAPSVMAHSVKNLTSVLTAVSAAPVHRRVSGPESLPRCLATPATTAEAID